MALEPRKPIQYGGGFQTDSSNHWSGFYQSSLEDVEPEEDNEEKPKTFFETSFFYRKLVDKEFPFFSNGEVASSSGRFRADRLGHWGRRFYLPETVIEHEKIDFTKFRFGHSEKKPHVFVDNSKLMGNLLLLQSDERKTFKTAIGICVSFHYETCVFSTPSVSLKIDPTQFEMFSLYTIHREEDVEVGIDVHFSDGKSHRLNHIGFDPKYITYYCGDVSPLLLTFLDEITKYLEQKKK